MATEEGRYPMGRLSASSGSKLTAPMGTLGLLLPRRTWGWVKLGHVAGCTAAMRKLSPIFHAGSATLALTNPDSQKLPKS